MNQYINQFVVAYDVREGPFAEGRRQQIADWMDQHAGRRLQSSVWAVPFDGTEFQLGQELQRFLSADDRLMVLRGPPGFEFNSMGVQLDRLAEQEAMSLATLSDGTAGDLAPLGGLQRQLLQAQALRFPPTDDLSVLNR